MKIIKTEKIYLAPAINFLQGISLKASDSRVRSKIVKKYMDSYNDFQSDIEDFKKLLNNESDTLTGEDAVEYNALQRETTEIQLEDTQIDKLKEILDTYDQKLSGEDAEIYDILMDQIELVIQ